MAAKPGRNSRAAVSRPWRCAISPFSRATNDLVLATHGRGIWIIDDITPLRALTPDLLNAGSEPSSPRDRSQQRIEANGGWANGAAVFVGDNPPDAAVITYYQRSRHLFGKLKIEVLDASGKVVDSLAGEQTSRTESRHLEHARETAAGSAGRANRHRRHHAVRVFCRALTPSA